MKAREGSRAGRTGIALCTLVLIGLIAGANRRANANSNDWQRLWQPDGATLPKPTKVHIGSLGGLGPDVENRDWLMVPTQHHQLLFQDSTDRKKVAELSQLIDGLYVFLDGRSPTNPATPIRAFLVPNEYGRSRCSRTVAAMRTGDQGEVPFLLASLLHEETHLFNFAFLGSKAQGWWAGEFCCVYFQERAHWGAKGRNLKLELQSRLPGGPVARLAELDAHGKGAFNEALATLFFLEETYGRERMDQFRRQCLIASKATDGGSLPQTVFKEVFGKNPAMLDHEWRAFYGWAGAVQEKTQTASDPRLKVKVTYVVQKASVQDIVQELGSQVGLGYNYQESKALTDPLCRRYVNGVAIDNKLCGEALQGILDPIGLRFQIEGNVIILYRK